MFFLFHAQYGEYLNSQGHGGNMRFGASSYHTTAHGPRERDFLAVLGGSRDALSGAGSTQAQRVLDGHLAAYEDFGVSATATRRHIERVSRLPYGDGVFGDDIDLRSIPKALRSAVRRS